MSNTVAVSGRAAEATPHVSEIPFAILPMTAGQARDISRSWQRVAKRLRDSAGKPREVRLAERRAQWWLAYAIALRRVAVGVHPNAVEMRAAKGIEGIGMSTPHSEAGNMANGPLLNASPSDRSRRAAVQLPTS